MRFQYSAMGADGSPKTGTLEASDKRTAIKELRSQSLVPTSLKPVTANQGSSKAQISTAEGKRRGRVGRKQITSFTRELAALLGAGIPVSQALSSLSEEEENAALSQIIQELSEGLRSGLALSEAMEAKPKLFNDLYVSMVRVGEEAGALEEVMNDLADMMEHQDEVRGEMSAAVSYPLFVLGFGFLSVTILLGFVLPRLFGMLQDMLDTLPLPTLILLGVANFLKSYGLWVLIGIVGCAVPLVQYLRTSKGQMAFDKFKLAMPVIGPVVRSAALSRFAQTLGALAKNGVSLLPALKIVEDTIGNRALGAQVALVAEDTRGGDSLAQPLKRLKMFPATAIQMIRVGEESGTLDSMLLKVAAIEERRLRGKTKTVINLVAPVLILGVGAVIGFIVVAILLPIFNMSSAIS